jgi:hypothetical protein
MAPRAIPPILASGLAQLLMLLLVQVVVLADSLSGPPPALATEAITTPLTQRSDAWPQWSLPAPLEQPGRRDLTYPAWFAGTWQVHSDGLVYTVRFSRTTAGGVVGDRAFNAQAIGTALLGKALQAVANDPANPNRQIATFKTPSGPAFSLESTVVGRRQEPPSPTRFEADELALQVLHGPGDPRVSRVETLSRYRLVGPDHIDAEQWQASYRSPGEGLVAPAQRSWGGQLTLERDRPDPQA